MSAWVAIAIAFASSSSAIVMLRPVCLRLGLVDRPGGRKHHTLDTPLCGGLAIAFSVIVLGSGYLPSRQFLGFVFGLTILLILGAMDDRKPVSTMFRLTMQGIAIAGGMCYLGNLELSNLGALTGSGDVMLGPVAAVFTVFAAVGIINAVNMIDGMDGLAGGFSMLIVVVLAVLAADTRAVSNLALCVTIGSVLGFLVFNLRTPWHGHARIFLGDAGSFVLGYILVWFVVQSSQVHPAVIDPITGVWLFGLPLADTCYLMIARMLRGTSPLAGDRYHFHHWLQRAGLTPGWALYAWLFVAACFMAAGVIGQLAGVSEVIRYTGFVATFLVYVLVMDRAWRYVKNKAPATQGFADAHE